MLGRLAARVDARCSERQPGLMRHCGVWAPRLSPLRGMRVALLGRRRKLFFVRCRDPTGGLWWHLI